MRFSSGSRGDLSIRAPATPCRQPAVATSRMLAFMVRSGRSPGHVPRRCGSFACSTAGQARPPKEFRTSSFIASSISEPQPASAPKIPARRPQRRARASLALVPAPPAPGWASAGAQGVRRPGLVSAKSRAASACPSACPGRAIGAPGHVRENPANPGRSPRHVRQGQVNAGAIGLVAQPLVHGLRAAFCPFAGRSRPGSAVHQSLHPWASNRAAECRVHGAIGQGFPG